MTFPFCLAMKVSMLYFVLMHKSALILIFLFYFLLSFHIVCICIFAHLTSCKHLQVLETNSPFCYPNIITLYLINVICDIYNILSIESNE